MSDQNRVGRFIRIHSTNSALMQNLAGDSDISALNEPARYTRDAQGHAFGVLLVPLRDGAGDPMGIIAVARDFSGTRAAGGRSLVWQICLAIFAIVILSGVVIVVIRGFLLRPLGVIYARMGERLAGETVEPLEGKSQFCAEVKEWAEREERIAPRRQGA